jgi:crossover junction endodeoxyribonuclease RusA
VSAPVVLTLPYPVSANRYWKAITIPGRTMMAPTKEAKAYQATCRAMALAAGMRIPLDGRVALRVDLYPERPQDWAKRAASNPDFWDDTVRCMDLGNCEKVLCDALNGIAWIDDKQLRRIYLERQEPDAQGARAVVTIGRLHQVPVAADLFAA